MEISERQPNAEKDEEFLEFLDILPQCILAKDDTEIHTPHKK